MNNFDFNKYPHRRKNILTGEWVLVSPHRMKRPWQGEVNQPNYLKREEYDPKCYLCPGNERAGGKKNDDYTSTYVFVNDFSSLLLDTPDYTIDEKDDLFISEPEKGICKVICFSPKHDLTLAEMEIDNIRKIVNVWQNEYNIIGSMPEINYVQIFENKGSVMGCSNPHPHGQIWAQKSIPNEVAKESERQEKYFYSKKSTLLKDYLKAELEKKERIIYQNKHFVVLVPFWSIWPYETLIISKNSIPSIKHLNEQEKNDLAEILKIITVKYDNFFQTSCPYSSGIHQAPTDGLEHPEWHFHIHFYPPLLRSASVKKFMVGYELLAGPQRDLTPEQAASQLKKMSNKHYLENP